jgi:CRP-like cAMP-binding protein
MSPRDKQSLQQEAEAHLARGDHESAYACLDEVHRLDPLDAEVDMRLGQLAILLGLRTEAAVYFRAAAFLHAYQGQPLRAIAAAQAVLTIDPSHTETQRLLASLYARQEPAPSRASAPATPAMPPAAPATSLEDHHLQAVLGGRPVEEGHAPGEEAIIDLDEELVIEEMAASSSELRVEHPAPRPPPPPPGSATAAAPPSPVDTARRSLSQGRRLVALPRVPLFSGLPRAALEQLVSQLAVEKRTAGETVVREGEEGDSLYAIVSGKVTVSRGSPDNVLATLEPGDFFGELALVTRDPRTATVTVIEAAELLRISRGLISEVVIEHPEVLTTILSFVRARLVSLLLSSSPFFGVLGSDERKALAAEFQLREINAGATVVRQGERSAALHVVLAGQLAVEVSGRDEPVARLAAGDVFGELSLLGEAAALATVRAERRSWTLALPRNRFQRVVVGRPEVMAYLVDLAEARERALATAQGQGPEKLALA